MLRGCQDDPVSESSGTGSPAKRPTIHDVARVAEVSHQTVSRYLRRNGGLKPRTEQRIAAAVAQLDYRPNLLARSMRTRRSGRLAVHIPAIAYDPARMLSGAASVAHDAGYVVDVLSFEGGVEARTERLLEIADSGQIEGLLSFAPLGEDVRQRLSRTIAITVAAEFDDEMRGIGDLADASPIAEIVEHLATLGHRRFLHVAGDPGFASARAREQVYRDTIASLGLESLGVAPGDWTGASGAAAVDAIDEGHRPTAVIAANDEVAAGVIRAASRRGWRMPHELSVTGWGDAPYTPFLTPSLTSVSVDMERVGSNAMRRLLRDLGVAVEEPVSAPLARVLWRESSGPPAT